MIRFCALLKFTAELRANPYTTRFRPLAKIRVRGYLKRGMRDCPIKANDHSAGNAGISDKSIPRKARTE